MQSTSIKMNVQNMFLWLCVVLCSLIAISSAKLSIESSTNDLTFEVNSSGHFFLELNEVSDDTICFEFNYTKGSNVVPLPDSCFKNGSKAHLPFVVTAQKAGHTVIRVNATPTSVDTSQAFVRVGVYKVGTLTLVSSIIGWLYFVCWSVSFYPQIINNWRRKSVVGLNFDFLGLNITGFIAYSVYNIGLLYNDEVKAEYHSLNPTGIIPVEVNDVVFAVHAAFATAVTIGQCFIYERGNQLISKATVAALALIWSTAGVFLLITALDLNKHIPWLSFLYYFSYVKLAITLTKYIPQVVYNCKRKSTEGWSIGTVLLDFIGGLFSITQMFINAYNFSDWPSIFGNFTKFGLGVVSVTFDVIFMVQHYCLYRPKSHDSMTDLLAPQCSP